MPDPLAEMAALGDHWKGPSPAKVPRIMLRIRHVAIAAALLCSSASLQAQSIADLTGLTALKKRLGAANTPTGANVLTSITEAPGPGHLPDPNNAEFAGKTFINMSPGTGISGHATVVGQHYFGTLTSISPGVTSMHCYEAGHFLSSGYLNGTGITPPKVVPWKISNNSWISTGNAITALRKFDGESELAALMFIGGVNNGTGALDSTLMALMYNGLAVGRSDGQHKAGFTSGVGSDGPGRIKPELVAPAGATSFSTPLVSSECAVLVQTARTHPALVGNPEAERNDTLKAVMMAGATHRAGWTNNAPTSGPARGATSQPIDLLWGADQINVNKSHWILTGGERDGAATIGQATTTLHAAWDSETILSSGSLWWRFEVEALKPYVSIVANWNRRVTTNYGAWSLPDLSLELWRVDALGQPQSLVGDAGLAHFSSGNVRSTSSADNIEHLYVRDLQPGSYALELRRATDALPGWLASVAWEFQCPEATLYGTGKVSSLGTTPVLDAKGIPSLAQDSWALLVSNAVPSVNGLAFYGTAAGSMPFFGGTLWVAPPLQRLPITTTDATGAVEIPVAIDPTWVGQERFFQFWFRDPTHPDGTTVGLSSAVQVRFCP